MANDTFFILITPQYLSQLNSWQATPAHHIYQIGTGFRLHRANLSRPPKGGLMVLSDTGINPCGSSDSFCQEVLRECASRGFSGVILDLERRIPPLEQCVAKLNQLFLRSGRTLFVPENYGFVAPQAKVLISSALSGGSLVTRLAEAKQRFGRDRIVLAVERVREDFVLPSPSGSGVPLSQEQLEETIRGIRPNVFFSPELCSRYFTYMGPDGNAHFVLFDDGETLAYKLEAARRMEVYTFVIPWQEAALCPERLGMRPVGETAGVGVSRVGMRR